MYEYIFIFCITSLYFYYFYFYENHKKSINNESIIIKKTNNLYENWVKKPEMRNIIHITKDLPNTIIFNNLITIFMLETIYNNISKNINSLAKDPLQKQYLTNNFKKIYMNLIEIYDKNYYSYYNVFMYGFNYYKYKNKIKKIVKPYLNKLIYYDIPKEYLPMDSLFRGIHQLIEINLIYILNNHKDIKKILNNDITCARKLIYKNINVWQELIQLLNLLVTLDEYDYQHYRNLIYGTSGGESINLRHIQKEIQKIDELLDFDIVETLLGNDLDKKLLVSSIKLYQYYSTQFWMTHFNLAASTNGLDNKGTMGTPIPKLIDKCFNMIKTDINNSINKISQNILKNDEYKKNVIINDVEKKIGLSVYNSSKSILKDV